MLHEPLPGEKPRSITEQSSSDLDDDGFMSAMATIGGG
jgi:hypothetical protein